MPVSNIGLAAPSAGAPLSSWNYEIRDLRDDDVLIEVYYCGICHSDIHMVKNDWKASIYPMVPGHEFTGVAVKVGSKVTKHKAGDRVGVGCMVGSCRNCNECKRNLEQYCKKNIQTYSMKMPDGEITYGGYGRYVVVQQDFVMKVPESLPMDAAAPLFCAGITTYSPCKHHKMDRGGLKVGVVGLGGLGHMAVQWAAVMGNEVVVLSRSNAKKEMALELGAKDLIAISDEEAGKTYKGQLSYIIDTVSAEKPIDKYLEFLAVDGVLISVGAPPVHATLCVPPLSLIGGRKSIQGSAIGGIAETQEMINFAAEKKILPYIELITGDKVNEAYAKTISGDVRFRFVIDVRKTHASK
eukprot:Blabericola_migrator_1__145@NODE_1038_length_5633_cov_251_042041_g410_i1_p3_GENE_NODE_1038_length_5633_cov_251_042041_g410_i1NODE_1038_length_5633_cov_251_042041_g410_i1_p3_ORF_typecomplete_len354_score50_89ADH_N/PF08240_12/1_1e30ADH_zinc_N/PF00107_26/1_9e18Glu_dehyd_C/PF16912_5/6_8e09AlaDh_PNT_C/PF01262_21/0_000112Hacid_dh_C/PF02826_19/0_00037ADH_zinc_N_2/PF13602_6/0_0055Shikimate_DH/PF01488_20/0_0064NAD_binding_2/PF03446_15/0_0323HCDH_N/PF02737_18/0_113HCDH_N/PF02737_18/3_8e03GFO_IDH_MocA/PF01